jgi:hypothetical protein
VRSNHHFGTYYTGPETEAQLVALRHLDGIAVQQASTGPEMRESPVREPESVSNQEEAKRGRVPWELIGILVGQAVLSLRLIWSNAAFEDEALYLWVGHLEWAHWLHGEQIQSFQTWFSGCAGPLSSYGGGC